MVTVSVAATTQPEMSPVTPRWARYWRRDQQVKLRFRIELGEIEAPLREQPASPLPRRQYQRAMRGWSPSLLQDQSHAIVYSSLERQLPDYMVLTTLCSMVCRYPNGAGPSRTTAPTEQATEVEQPPWRHRETAGRHGTVYIDAIDRNTSFFSLGGRLAVGGATRGLHRRCI